MGAVVVEAVPAIAFGTLGKAVAILLSVVVQDIMLAGDVEKAVGLNGFERLLERVEL